MAQKDWDIFETECYEYLKNKYRCTGADFTHFGGSDSTTADVKAETPSGKSFFIEAKKANAQCGQFVLIANDSKEKFEYSPKNGSPLNDYSQEIMDYMNHHYAEYAACGTAGCQLPLDKSIFYGWIENYYTGKGVDFFMTKQDSYLIFPLGHFRHYFDVTAAYRIKKSGSSDPSVKNRPELTALLADIGDYTLEQDGKHLLIRTSAALTDVTLAGPHYSYLFRYESQDCYRIRRLSNTYNANVIFSISLKELPDSLMAGSDLSLFEEALQ